MNTTLALEAVSDANVQCGLSTWQKYVFICLDKYTHTYIIEIFLSVCVTYKVNYIRTIEDIMIYGESFNLTFNFRLEICEDETLELRKWYGILKQ